MVSAPCMSQARASCATGPQLPGQDEVGQDGDAILAAGGTKEATVPRPQARPHAQQEAVGRQVRQRPANNGPKPRRTTHKTPPRNQPQALAWPR